jgi:hypothetical protein
MLRHRPKVWAGPLVVLVIALLWAIVFVLPVQLVSREGLTRKQLLDARNDVRTSLLTALGGAIALGGGVVAGYVGLRELAVNREGQIAERFTRAIDQLGDERMDVRLGGIYALERIARDSRADHGPVVEVLTAYLRQHHSYLAGPAPDYDWSHYKRTGLAAPDLQAVLRVLGRRKIQHDHLSFIALYLEKEGDEPQEFPVRLDLTSLNLYKLDLKGTDLRQALLRGSNASLADLSHANLEGALLVAVEMRAVRLARATLRGALLLNADVANADLSHADLRSASVLGTDVSGAVMNGARLEGADLTSAEGLTKEQIASAVVDGTTRLPEHVA